MNVQIPVKWLQELLALCGPEDHELRERVIVSITAMDEQVARAVVLPEPVMFVIDRFDAYFRSANGVPPNARISVPTSEWQELRALLATGGQWQKVITWHRGAGLMWDVHASGKWLLRVVSPLNWDAHSVHQELVHAGYAEHIDVRQVHAEQGAAPTAKEEK